MVACIDAYICLLLILTAMLLPDFKKLLPKALIISLSQNLNLIKS